MAKFKIVVIASPDYPSNLERFVEVCKLKERPVVYPDAKAFEQALQTSDKYVIIQILNSRELKEEELVNFEKHHQAIFAYYIAKDWAFPDAADFLEEWNVILQNLKNNYQQPTPQELASSFAYQTVDEVIEIAESLEIDAYILTNEIIPDEVKQQIENILFSAKVNKVNYVNSPNRIDWFHNPNSSKIIINLMPRVLPVGEFGDRVFLYAHLNHWSELIEGIEASGYGMRIQQAIFDYIEDNLSQQSILDEYWTPYYTKEILAENPISGWDPYFGIFSTINQNLAASEENYDEEGRRRFVHPAEESEIHYIHTLGFRTLLAVIGLTQEQELEYKRMFQNAAAQITDESSVGFFKDFETLADISKHLPSAVFNIINFSDEMLHAGMGIPYGFTISLTHPSEFFENPYIYTLVMYMRDLVLAGRLFQTINARHINLQ